MNWKGGINSEGFPEVTGVVPSQIDEALNRRVGRKVPEDGGKAPGDNIDNHRECRE